MKRRDAVLAASMSAAAPFVRAQAPRKLPRVAYVWMYADGPSAPFPEAFTNRMRELGLRPGIEVELTFHDADGDPAKLAQIAKTLVRDQVDVVVAACTPEARALRQETKTIPIVMVATGDPVKAGLVQSLARPGTNVTGISTMSLELSAKRLAMLKEIHPTMRQAVVVWNPERPDNQPEVEAMQHAADRLGVRLRSAQVRSKEQLDVELDALGWDGTQGLLNAGDSLITKHRRLIAARAAALKLPALYEDRGFVEVGGLMSFGPSLRATHARGADYVDRILKGAKAAELPIEQPTRFELVIDLRAARALRLEVPRSLLIQADEVLGRS